MSEVRFNLGAYSHIVIDVADELPDDNGLMARRLATEVVMDTTEVAEALQTWWDEKHPEGAQGSQQEPYRGEDGDPGPQDQGESRPGFRRPKTQGQQGGGGQRNNYPPNGLMSTIQDSVNWTCDRCGNQGEGVARRQRTGKMKGDTIVCLNPDCKENDYRRTITFLEAGTDRDQRDN